MNDIYQLINVRQVVILWAEKKLFEINCEF